MQLQHCTELPCEHSRGREQLWLARCNRRVCEAPQLAEDLHKLTTDPLDPHRGEPLLKLLVLLDEVLGRLDRRSLVRAVVGTTLARVVTASARG